MVIACGVTCSQLIAHPAINRVHATRVGAIIPGHDFMQPEKEYKMDSIIIIIVFTIITCGALMPTVNFFSLFSSKARRLYTNRYIRAIDILIIIVYFKYFIFVDHSMPDAGSITSIFYNYSDRVYEFTELMHTPLAKEHSTSIKVIVIFALFGQIGLTFWRNSLPPLLHTLSISTVMLGMIINIFAIQHLIGGTEYTLHSSHAEILLSEGVTRELYPYNFTIKPSFITLEFYLFFIFSIMASQLALLHATFLSIKASRFLRITYTNRALKLAQRAIALYPPYINPLYIMVLFPVAGLFIIVLVLCGQQPDAVVKAFTETSDWGFSQIESPPPRITLGHPYSGMYLCTIALTGHANLVRPIGYGWRTGGVIPVNRQMLVCNAFEQLLEQSMPRLHGVARKAYDIFCIPFNALAWNKYAADVIYLLMKPLEYFFIIALYCFDKSPEDRIARQYSYCIHSKI